MQHNLCNHTNLIKNDTFVYISLDKRYILVYTIIKGRGKTLKQKLKGSFIMTVKFRIGYPEDVVTMQYPKMTAELVSDSCEDAETYYLPEGFETAESQSGSVEIYDENGSQYSYYISENAICICGDKGEFVLRKVCA